MSFVAQLRQGSKEAYEELYNKHHRKIFQFAFKHSGDATRAEDITREVFLKIWEKRKSLSEHVDFESQIFTIILPFLVSEYRKKLVEQKAYQFVLLEALNGMPDNASPHL